MKKNKIFFVSLAGIVIIFIALLGFSYGYYLTNVQGNSNTHSILVTSSDLSLKYAEGEGSNIELDNIEPGVKASKTFTVYNDGNTLVSAYGVYLEDIVNTFSRTQDLKYRISCVATKGNENLGDCGSSTNYYPTVNSRLMVNSIEAGVTHTYTLELEYVYLDDVNQSEDMGKTINGKVQIYAESDVVTVKGTVTGVTYGDYILIESDNKTSQIDLTNNSYTLTGIGVGSHTIKVMNKSASGTVTTRGSKEVIIRKALTSRFDTNNQIIYLDDYSEIIDIDITSISTNLTLSISEPSIYETGTFSRTLLNNTAVVEKYDSSENSTGLIANSSISTFTLPITSTETNGARSGMYRMLDDEGVSYFYRGTVRNNYVNFAGFTWRVVRINGDGSIRLVLDGTLAKICASQNSTVCVNSYYNIAGDNAYTGYMYGLTGITTNSNRCLKLDGSDNVVNVVSTYSTKKSCENSGGVWTTTAYEATHANIKSSAIKNIVDSFYENFLSSYNQYLADSKFCADKTLGTVGTGIGTVNTNYSANDRINVKSNVSPTLKCNGKYSSYSVKENLKYPIALLTSDELILAGGYKTTLNNTYYLTDSDNLYDWFTMTPMSFSSSIADVGISRPNGISFISNSVLESYGVRPVINLRADILYNSGDGKSGSPYTIKLS